mgnify:FL=1
MEKDKLYMINKIFDNKKVRTVWDKESEKYYVSIIDIIEVLTGSARPRKYWSDLKKQLKTWSGMTSKEYKEYKGLRKENLRDNMDSIELILTNLSEEATKRLAEKHKSVRLDGNIKVAKVGGSVAKVARKELESNLEESIVTSSNRLDYEYNDKEMIMQK